MTQHVANWTDSAGTRVLEGLMSAGLPLLPKDVTVYDVTDTLGEDAWRLVLVLPAPRDGAWDRQAVFQARRKAIEIFDGIAGDDGRSLPGSTIATITTDDADEQDTALPDEPEEGEDPGRTP